MIGTISLPSGSKTGGRWSGGHRYKLLETKDPGVTTWGDHQEHASTKVVGLDNWVATPMAQRIEHGLVNEAARGGRGQTPTENDVTPLQSPALHLGELAKAKRLPEDFLRQMRLSSPVRGWGSFTRTNRLASTGHSEHL